MLIRGYTLIQNTKLRGLRYLHLDMNNIRKDKHYYIGTCNVSIADLLYVTYYVI